MTKAAEREGINVRMSGNQMLQVCRNSQGTTREKKGDYNKAIAVDIWQYANKGDEGVWCMCFHKRRIGGQLEMRLS